MQCAAGLGARGRPWRYRMLESLRMPRDPGGRQTKAPPTEPPRDWPGLEVGSAQRLPRAVPLPRRLLSRLIFEWTWGAQEILAQACSRFRSTQYRREILREFGSGHHFLAPCRARAFRQICLHMREKRDHAPRVAQ